MHVFTLTEAWTALKETIATGLEGQAKLLEGIDYDLDSISQLSVHPEFLALNSNRRIAAPNSPSAERDVEEIRGEGVKTKMLGEYVSRPKMKVVVESCRKIHGKCPSGSVEKRSSEQVLLADLVQRFRNAQTSMEDLMKGATEVRTAIHSDGYVAHFTGAVVGFL
jgi:hypothetical protein